MLRLKKVAVTGGIACGKSTFCSFLMELGAYVVSADKIVHQLLSQDTNLCANIVNLLGPDVVVDNKINRDAIAKTVFNNPQLLRSLEGILHPAVFGQIDKEYIQACKAGNYPLFVAEIPLLFEVENKEHVAKNYFDSTIAVLSDEALCKKRYTSATGKTEEEYQKRSSEQLPQQEKAARAHYVVINNGNLEELFGKAKIIFDELTKFSERV